MRMSDTAAMRQAARLSAAAAHSGMEGKPVERGEIAEIVQSVVVSLRGDLTARDVGLHQELDGLVRLISAARSEIAALRPDEINEKHLPAATDELDAIVGATEAATSEILDAVEKIEALAPSTPPEISSEIGNMVTRIYEACNFQDITGQRITKVVRTLKQIEQKVNDLARAFGDGGIERPDPTPAPAAEEAPAKPTDQDLLNGPQLPTNAKSQADIDALFAS